MKSASKVDSRDFVERDKAEVNELYNLVANRSRTTEQFEWEWLRTPYGWGSMWVLYDTGNGKIVGHHGLIPVPLVFFGRTILTGKTENSMMHPLYRGRGLYTPFETRCLERARERFDMTWTTDARHEHGRVRAKLGYVTVGHYAMYVRATRRSSLETFFAEELKAAVPRGLASAVLLVTKPASILFWLLSCRRLLTDPRIAVEKIESLDPVREELDAFWQENKAKFGITPDRRTSYLRWRFLDNPNVRGDFHLARRRGEIVGYIVTKAGANGGIEIGDVVSADVDGDVFVTLIQYALSKAADGKGVLCFRTLRSNNHLNSVLKRCGFLEVRRMRRVMARVLRLKAEETVFKAKTLSSELDPDAVSDPGSWYFTELFLEGTE